MENILTKKGALLRSIVEIMKQEDSFMNKEYLFQRLNEKRLIEDISEKRKLLSRIDHLLKKKSSFPFLKKENSHYTFLDWFLKEFKEKIFNEKKFSAVFKRLKHAKPRKTTEKQAYLISKVLWEEESPLSAKLIWERLQARGFGHFFGGETPINTIGRHLSVNSSLPLFEKGNEGYKLVTKEDLDELQIEEDIDSEDVEDEFNDLEITESIKKAKKLYLWQNAVIFLNIKGKMQAREIWRDIERFNLWNPPKGGATPWLTLMTTLRQHGVERIRANPRKPFIFDKDEDDRFFLVPNWQEIIEKETPGGLQPILDTSKEIKPLLIEIDEDEEETEEEKPRQLFNYPRDKETSLAILNQNYGQEFIQRIYRILLKKKQIILVGPPGTGKTFFARHFAQIYANTHQIIQFHPSYEYSDFIQGWVPDEEAETPRFKLKDKIFILACEEAQILQSDNSDPESCLILIIDEINRGNLGKIFGELISGLEDREEPITLASGSTIAIPSNLLIIGTMNSADRSVGVIDKALRRRFHFIDFKPDAQILENALNSLQPPPNDAIDSEIVVTLFKDINDEVIDYCQDSDRLLGHTLFIHDNWTDLNDEIEMTIIPYIKETFYGDTSILQKLYNKLNEKYKGKLPSISKLNVDIDLRF